MTIGIRDTRKIDAKYNMTSQDVHNQAVFDDSIGISPNLSMDTESLFSLLLADISNYHIGP